MSRVQKNKRNPPVSEQRMAMIKYALEGAKLELKNNLAPKVYVEKTLTQNVNYSVDYREAYKEAFKKYGQSILGQVWLAKLEWFAPVLKKHELENEEIFQTFKTAEKDYINFSWAFNKRNPAEEPSEANFKICTFPKDQKPASEPSSTTNTKAE